MSTAPTIPTDVVPLPLPISREEAHANAQLLRLMTNAIQRATGCTLEQARKAAVAALPALLEALED